MNGSTLVIAPLLAMVALLGCSSEPEVPMLPDWTTAEGNYCVPVEDSARRTGADEALLTYTCRIRDGETPGLEYIDFTNRWNCRSRRLIERSGVLFFEDKKERPRLNVPMDQTVLPGTTAERLMDFACSRPIG